MKEINFIHYLLQKKQQKPCNMDYILKFLVHLKSKKKERFERNNEKCGIKINVS